MQLEIIPVLISVLSLGLATVSIAWNIYRDVLMKPRLKMGLSIGTMLSPSGNHGTFIQISAVNFGPGPIYCRSLHFRNTSWWRRILRKETYAYITHDYKNRYSSQFPQRLDQIFKSNAPIATPMAISSDVGVGFIPSRGPIEFSLAADASSGQAQNPRLLPIQEKR